MSRAFRALGVAFGIVVGAILLFFGALMIDWGGSSARAEKDSLVARALSPDNQSVAEIHVLTTAMHGGPDKIYVTISRIGSAAVGRVYERTYECDDLSAFRLRWDNPHDLKITYGECDAAGQQAKVAFKDFNDKQQNRVWRNDATWRDVNITYEDTQYVARH